MTLTQAYEIINTSETHRVLNCTADFGRDRHLITPFPNSVGQGEWHDSDGVIAFAKNMAELSRFPEEVMNKVRDAIKIAQNDIEEWRMASYPSRERLQQPINQFKNGKRVW